MKNLFIESEKGRECTLLNPWSGKVLTLYSNGKKAERVAGERVTFKTSPGEQIEGRPL